jgi:Tol biopolymer transport system component
VKNGVRFFLLGLVAATLTLSIAPAATGGEAQDVVVFGNVGGCVCGFSTVTVSGTTTSTQYLPAGLTPAAFSPAANGSVAFIDGASGALWLMHSEGTVLELDSSPNDGQPSISPDGSEVAFSRFDPTTGSGDIYVVNSDGSGLTRIADGRGDNRLDSPAFSPDGNSIAYTCRPATNPIGDGLGCGPSAVGTYRQGGIMLMSADGTDQRMIVVGSSNGAGGDSLSWSPDGQWLTTADCAATTVADGQSCAWQIFAYHTDGSDLLRDDDTTRQVTHENGPAVVAPKFTADGSEILFQKTENNQTNEFAIDPGGTNEHQVVILGGFEVVPPANGGGPAPTVSVPDTGFTGAGSPVVVESQLPQCSGFVVEAADGALTNCVPVTTSSMLHNPNAEYSVAADDSIVYDDFSQGQDVFDNAAGPVWLVGPNRTPLELDSSPYDFDASISYDGTKVIFARFDPATWGSDLYVVNANGSGLTRVAAGGGNNYLSSPEFAPDGASIAYLCADAGHRLGTGLGCGPSASGAYAASGLMLMNAAGTDQRMLVSGAGNGANPFTAGFSALPEYAEGISWSPDGTWLTASACPELVPFSDECTSTQVFAYRTDGSDVFDALDPSTQVTHEPANDATSLLPQFCGNSTQILFSLNWDSSGNMTEPSSAVVDRDGADRHQVSLWPGGQAQKAECVPPATGAAAPATVNVVEPLAFPSGQVAVKSTIPQCNGFVIETGPDIYDECIQATPDFEQTYDHFGYDVAADHSIVFTESNVAGVWLARPGKAPVQLDANPHDADPSISPDGSKIAFVRADPDTTHGYSTDLYVINADGSGLQLADDGFGTRNDDFPTFSPDGTTIAYIQYFSGIMLMNVDGSNKREIVSASVGGNGGLSWSPDAKRVVMDINGDAYAYPTDGSDLFDGVDPKLRVTHLNDVQEGGPMDVQFTSDGSQILFEYDVFNDSWTTDTPTWNVINPDGTNQHEVFLTPGVFSCGPGGCSTAGFPWGVVVPPPTGGRVPKLVRPSFARVPDVHALSLHSAEKRLARVHLTGKVEQQRFSSRVKRGHVISQHPRARTRTSLKKKRTRVVHLVLSRGKRPAR